MFNVRLTFNHTVIRTVYAVQQLENGLTQFLLYDDVLGKWGWMPASQYEPIADEKKPKKTNKKG